VSILLKAIGPDEYDAAVRSTPAACVPAAMGDGRSGRQLLADFARDARRSVAAFGTAPADADLQRILEYTVGLSEGVVPAVPGGDSIFSVDWDVPAARDLLSASTEPWSNALATVKKSVRFA
jgi:hypothetical protein